MKLSTSFPEVFVTALAVICMHEVKFHQEPLWKFLVILALALFLFYLDSKDTQSIKSGGK